MQFRVTNDYAHTQFIRVSSADRTVAVKGELQIIDHFGPFYECVLKNDGYEHILQCSSKIPFDRHVYLFSKQRLTNQ